jgi:hypothetical protein
MAKQPNRMVRNAPKTSFDACSLSTKKFWNILGAL